MGNGSIHFTLQFHPYPILSFHSKFKCQEIQVTGNIKGHIIRNPCIYVPMEMSTLEQEIKPMKAKD